MSDDATTGEGHFQDLATRAHAAKLGMWVFLASEALLFAALFALYAAARVQHPNAFHEGVGHTDKLLGSVNTVILLTSSFTVAASVRMLESSRRAASLLLLFASVALGALFLALKLIEWKHHVRDGIVPGAGTAFFEAHPEAGLPVFVTLYYVMTGLHALHVVIGIGVLSFVALGVARDRVTAARSHRLEIGALYWHLVDLIWIFLWPLFYLTGS